MIARSHGRCQEVAGARPHRPDRTVYALAVHTPLMWLPLGCAAIGLSTLAASFLVQGTAVPAQAPLRTKVVLIGTGTPNNDPDRSGPATAIVVDDRAYLVDAGPGVVRRAGAAGLAHGLAALAAPRLDRVFLTHLHSDHTLGLPDLMFSPWVLGRATPLDVYGPPGTAAMTGHLQAAYQQDIDIRLTGGEPSNKTGYGARAHEIAAGVVYRDSLVTIRAIEVPHGKWPHAFAYRFDTPDRSVVISGDTSPSDALAQACDGCDVLVHEVILSSNLAGRQPDWHAYHSAYHTSSLQLGEVAAKARPKLLVLSHQIPAGVDDAELLRDIRQRFSGAVVSGRDLGVYQLPCRYARPACGILRRRVASAGWVRLPVPRARRMPLCPWSSPSKIVRPSRPTASASRPASPAFRSVAFRRSKTRAGISSRCSGRPGGSTLTRWSTSTT